MTDDLDTYIGKMISITWLDPKAEERMSLRDFLMDPFAIVETRGVLRFVKDKIVVISTESCSEDDEEDLNSIHRDLILEFRIYKHEPKESGNVL